MKSPKFEEIERIRDRVRVALSWIGEGVWGDFDPEDPDDVALLRFDVDRLVDAEWLPVDDASYCTRLRVDLDRVILEDCVARILDEVYEPVSYGYSVKKLCERLSWITPEAGVLGASKAVSTP